MTNAASLVAAASVTKAKSGTLTFSTEMATVAVGGAADADLVLVINHSALNTGAGTDITTTGTADDLTINAGANTITVAASSATEDLTITSGIVANLTAAGILGNVAVTSTSAVAVTADTNAIGSGTITNGGAAAGTGVLIRYMNSVTSANITEAGNVKAKNN